MYIWEGKHCLVNKMATIFVDGQVTHKIMRFTVSLPNVHIHVLELFLLDDIDSDC